MDSHLPGGYPSYADTNRISRLAVEPSTGAGGVLGRIYQSLADFTVLTGLLQAAVDDRLARHLQVTGWQGGELRVHLDQPALATRWRFQEPAVRRALARHPRLSGLREIRLVMTDVRGRERPVPARPLSSPSLQAAPADALRELAAGEEHTRLREALLALSEAAAQARAGKGN